MAQCKAKAKSTGERCRRRAVDGSTVCTVHGAGGGGPRPGNQNARTHGGYSVVLSALTEAERESFDGISTDAAEQLDNEIRLCDIRLGRLFTFIRDNLGGMVHKDTEDAISRVQSQKARLIEAKQKLEAMQPPEDDVDVSHYTNALKEASENLTW